MRQKKIVNIRLTNNLKEKLLLWAQQFEEVVWLDSNAHCEKYSNYNAILAVDAFTAIKTDSFQAFQKLEEYQKTAKDWIFGYLTYDVKNDVEKLSSKNFDALHFPDVFFFQPKKLFLFSDQKVEIHYLNLVSDELETDWETILQTSVIKKKQRKQAVKIHIRTTKDSYFKKVKKLKEHIQLGDIYEANFCQEFFSEAVAINPLQTYHHLNAISQPPFAVFLKNNKHFAMCASPERYLKKEGTKIVSQPIKGTAKRSDSFKEDSSIKKQLKEDPKERSENIMIVDLVRNDLSRFALKNSVKVEELCAVYSFKQVHQLISTVSCKVAITESPVQVLKNTFPMGSMTGAPKISAMQIIEALEDAKRGLYSGTIGYFTPTGDFDFNVVIRTILYNQATNYLSFSVGGAITAASIIENEYQECLLKAKAMREVLEGS